MALIDKFMDKIVIDESSGCWNWIGAIHAQGYGIFWIGKTHTYAHIFAYKYFVGSIPKDMELGHIYPKDKCANYNHVRPITHLENMLESPTHNINKTHCPQNHEYSGANLYIDSKGARRCRTCKNESNRKYRNRNVLYYY